MITQLMAEQASRFENVLEDYLSNLPQTSSQLYHAIKYSSLGGGKRFRPFLVSQVAKLWNIDESLALKAAMAIELIHCYSLVHDDLPAMDDDDLRRGKATLHKKYDEATAILVGDALQSLAFEALSSPQLELAAEKKLKLIHALSSAAGAHGMVLGQMLDMQGERAESLTLNEVENIQRFKTGALIACSAQFGGILGGASAKEEKKLYQWGLFLGEAFQITDDLLDHLGNSEKMGKKLQKDDAKGKVTFVTLLGEEGAKARLYELEQHSENLLDDWGEKSNHLKDLWAWLIKRDY